MNEIEINLMVWTHLIYLGVAAAITVWVGRSLQRNGIVVATNGQEADRDIVNAFGRLLEVGFYLVGFGAINIALKYGGTATGTQSAVELLGTKIGLILLILGGLNFVLTIVFGEIRKQRQRDLLSRETAPINLDANHRRQTV